MSSPVPGQTLAERADIHKSCKSIETLLNVLNEYCEAAGAVVALQKKLAKALRETAAQKVVGEISANAMNASATVYEALSDIDSKFSKISDKEYDSVSAEVKKWFKKLAKEEKIHDDRIASANAKIKQAGQSYEKKSKKKATDAGEEHAKYINLISTLGPEVSQEKYNHALSVNQKHVATTYSVAACLSRLADTEWQKSCECVRRFSPTIGPLTQWRMLCEGGWTGPIPLDLPDVTTTNEQSNNVQKDSSNPAIPMPVEEEKRQPQLTTPASTRLTPEPQGSAPTEQLRMPPQGYATGPPSASESSNEHLRDQQSSHNSPTLMRQQPPISKQSFPTDPGTANASPPERLEPPKAPFVDAITGSVRSLSAFPAPPNHFPLPPPRSQQSSYFQSTASGSSNLNSPSHNRLADSPVSGPEDGPGPNAMDESSFETSPGRYQDALSSPSRHSPGPSPEVENIERARISEEQAVRSRYKSAEPEIKRPTPVRAQTLLPPESSYRNDREMPVRHDLRHRPSSSNDFKSQNTTSFNREQDIQEFGGIAPHSDKAHTENSKYSRGLERTDTVESSGSLVAAMRNRYTNNPGSISPPPRDLPRLPLSVNDLATRYQPSIDEPTSPRMRAGSPPVLRQQSLPLIETSARQVKEAYLDRLSGQTTHNQGHDRRRQQPYDDQAELDRRSKELSLRERERDLELRARDLERDRARLQTLLEDDGSQNVYHEGASTQSQTTQFGLRPRERRTSLRHQLQRPLSQMELDEADESTTKVSTRAPIINSNHRSHNQYSNDETRLRPPSSPTITTALPTIKPLHSPKMGRAHNLYPDKKNGSNTNLDTAGTSDHAPYCGCETCSVNKYKYSAKSDQQQPRESQLQQGQRTDKDKSSKPGGSWIRRLSMPVGNAFSLDSKRHQNNSSSGSIYGLGSGIGNTPVNPGRTRLFSMDGKKNASTTALLSSSTTSNVAHGLGVREDGRLRHERRSLETSGTSNNRSMTNLGLGTRQ